MITIDKVIEIIKEKDISQEVIDAIHAVIISNNSEENEMEHIVLSIDKTFKTYNSSLFVEHINH